MDYMNYKSKGENYYLNVKQYRYYLLDWPNFAESKVNEFQIRVGLFQPNYCIDEANQLPL